MVEVVQVWIHLVRLDDGQGCVCCFDELRNSIRMFRNCRVNEVVLMVLVVEMWIMSLMVVVLVVEYVEMVLVILACGVKNDLATGASDMCHCVRRNNTWLACLRIELRRLVCVAATAVVEVRKVCELMRMIRLVMALVVMD